MDTLVVLVPRLVSVGVLLIVVYYFFAIIGIETLHDRVMAGCWYVWYRVVNRISMRSDNVKLMHYPYFLCSNKSWYDVELYYRGMYEKNTSLADIPATPDVFYILNFDNILRSYGMYALLRRKCDLSTLRKIRQGKKKKKVKVYGNIRTRSISSHT